MVKKDIKILYVYKHDRSFIRRDLNILKRHFNVISFPFSLWKVPLLPILIARVDVVFIWFASYHAFITSIFTKLLSRKLIIVTGGYDVANEKEINYGLLLNPLLRRMVEFTLKRADKVLAVSEFNKGEVKKLINVDKVEVVYNSVDPKKFFPSGKKEDMVLTVGFITWENVKRKGLEIFVRVAKYLPRVKFVLVGAFEDDSIDFLKRISSPNVEFTGYISEEELVRYYQRAKVYCQLSYYESFGMAPAEAMLCECVPVVTKRGALPEVVGDCGFYVPYGDLKSTKFAIENAFANYERIGTLARKRALDKFSPAKREKKLVKCVLECCHESGYNG